MPITFGSTPSRRLPYPAEEPRPDIPSRTASLTQSQSRSLGNNHQSGHFDHQSNPARTTTSDAAPRVVKGAAGPTRRYSLVVQHGPSLDPRNKTPAQGLDRSVPFRATSANLNMNKRSSSCTSTMRNPTRPATVKRWAGLTRTVSDWDGLRRDPELWFEDGDCYVHLYARGQSRRGPSFNVPFQTLRESHCGAMLSLCFAQTAPPPEASPLANRRLSSGFSTPVSSTNAIELYIPAPEDTSRDAAFQWHLTTRNFFAFIFGKPLVGTHLGQTLVDLLERLTLFRSGQIDNRQDFLDFAEEQGYRDFVDCPDYSLAMLYFAEQYKIRDLWIDAFAHCVGMNDSLSLSQEFDAVSRLTKALITRAYLEMDIHLSRVTLALRNFLEDDLSPALLGLTAGARAHLDRFRSFLHGFYVEKFGYWPPPKGSSFSKVLYKSLYYDFKNLHDYLVDLESTTDLMTQKPASGGICVLQNVDLFDRRHAFFPLPHPLPLLPQHLPSTKKTNSQKTLRTLTLGSKQAKTDRYMTTRAALVAATNSTDITVTSTPIVQAYMRFERQCALSHQREEKVTMADSRKVRWLLIYGTLQYVISAIQAPKEVRDTEGSEYPLCCLVTEKSPWHTGTRTPNSPGFSAVNIPEAINSYLSENTCAVPDHLTPGAPAATSIQPDCQTDDYFTHTHPDAPPITSRPVSVEVPAPLRISTAVGRNTSMRSLRNLSLSARSSRRNSITKVASHPQPYCEIIVHGFGNGLNKAIIDPPSQAVSRSQSVNHSKRSSESTLPDGATPETSWLRPSTLDASSHSKRPAKLELKCSPVPKEARTPVIDSFQFDELVSPMHLEQHVELLASSDSTKSADSPFWSDEASSTSSKSSTNEERGGLERKCSSAEVSGLLGGLVPLDASPVSVSKDHKASKTASPTTPTTPNFGSDSEFRFSFNNQNIGLPGSSSLTGSPSSALDSTIGVALSNPAKESTSSKPLLSAAASSFSAFPTSDSTHDPLARSFSTESLTKLAPLSMHPPSPPSPRSPISSSRKDGVMDIFSALSLAPRQNLATEKASPTSSVNSRPKSKAAPRSIKQSPEIDMKKVVEEVNKARKKDRRMSFWRR